MISRHARRMWGVMALSEKQNGSATNRMKSSMKTLAPRELKPVAPSATDIHKIRQSRKT